MANRAHRRRLHSLPSAFKPVFTRGPRNLQGSLYARPASLPPKPATFPGSLPEWAVYAAHLALGLAPDVDFSYQAAEQGGRTEYGGVILDFLELDEPIAINVQGEYWHYGRGAEKIAADRAVGVQMAQYGITVIQIDEHDALAPYVLTYVRDARSGIDHSLGRTL